MTDYKMKNWNPHQPLAFTGPCIVADPCYFPELNRDWDNVCSQWLHKDNLVSHDAVVVEINGHKAVFCGTKYGDGTYFADGDSIVSQNRDLPVDAGTLAIIPRAAINELPDEGSYVEVNLTKPTDFHYANGNFWLDGEVSLEVLTDESDQEEDEEDDYFDEDEED